RLAFSDEMALKHEKSRGTQIAGGVAAISGYAIPFFFKRNTTRGVVQHGTDLIHEVIPAGPVDTPALFQTFTRRQNFFHNEPRTIVTRSGRSLRPEFFEFVTQNLAIFHRLNHAVAMVDAQAVNQSLG